MIQSAEVSRMSKGLKGRSKSNRSKRGIRSRGSKRRYREWKYYSRNQKEVARRLLEGDYESITTSGWGLLDRFFGMLFGMKFFDLLGLEPEGIKRKMIPVVKLLSSYSLKILLGISSMNKLTSELFREVALLQLIGFTAQEIKEGYTVRGRQRKDGSKREGPFHKDTLSDLLSKLKVEEVEYVLNGAVKLLDKRGFFPKVGTYGLDSSDLPTTDKYEGVGCKKVKRKKRSEGKLIEVEEWILGYKVLIVMEVKEKLVASAKVVRINDHESQYTLEMIEKVEENLGKGRIKVLVMDRGFLGGLSLWEVKHDYGIDFIVPLKEGMEIVKDARGLCKIGFDGESIFEEESKDGKIRAIGFLGLTSYDEYGDEKHQKKNKNSRDFQPNPINAVLVKVWDGEEIEKGEEVVFITTLDISEPVKIVCQYDLRSKIENNGFRELKQGWLLESYPNKSLNGVIAHIMLTLVMFNMAQAYKTREGQRLADKGIRRLRSEHFGSLQKVVVYAGDYFGIFDIEELMQILGKPPKVFFRADPKKILPAMPGKS
jgi:hypothetical protein